MITGTVTEVINQGTIVQVVVKDEEGREHCVNFDHRMYLHFEEAEGDPVGLEVEYDPDENRLSVL